MSKLIIVGTPIGNLEDTSIRAIRALLSAPIIACEDTRRTGNLIQLLVRKCDEWGIQVPNRVEQRRYISYRDQNHDKAVTEILGLLQQETDVLLVADSGMPTISDPGFKLVRDALDAGIIVDVIPGPTALTTALSISGLPTDKFIFLGFMPKKAGQLHNLLQQYGALPASLVIYESPIRIKKTLRSIHDALGERNVAICLELTKLHQQLLRGPITDLLDQVEKRQFKGECVIIVEK